jgi:hypothetical protein
LATEASEPMRPADQGVGGTTGGGCTRGTGGHGPLDGGPATQVDGRSRGAACRDDGGARRAIWSAGEQFRATLAEKLGAPLWTADWRLYNAFKETLKRIHALA